MAGLLPRFLHLPVSQKAAGGGAIRGDIGKDRGNRQRLTANRHGWIGIDRLRRRLTGNRNGKPVAAHINTGAVLEPDRIAFQQQLAIDQCAIGALVAQYIAVPVPADGAMQFRDAAFIVRHLPIAGRGAANGPATIV